ncbi:uncharacterized protein LOC143040212 [Oratosquilla oratoria]|uniref:uncharacterized protein LOC143040212 n=1 Tax=Oratosquilla oratoria TaxID=337810 RepID=UPI003F7702D2
MPGVFKMDKIYKKKSGFYNRGRGFAEFCPSTDDGEVQQEKPKDIPSCSFTPEAPHFSSPSSLDSFKGYRDDFHSYGNQHLNHYHIHTLPSQAPVAVPPAISIQCLVGHVKCKCDTQNSQGMHSPKFHKDLQDAGDKIDRILEANECEVVEDFEGMQTEVQDHCCFCCTKHLVRVFRKEHRGNYHCSNCLRKITLPTRHKHGIGRQQNFYNPVKDWLLSPLPNSPSYFTQADPRHRSHVSTLTSHQGTPERIPVSSATCSSSVPPFPRQLELVKETENVVDIELFERIETFHKRKQRT